MKTIAKTTAKTIVLLLLAAAPMLAQQVPGRSLSAPQVEYKEPFTEITDVRELRDGRVVVLDKRDRSLHLVDFAAQADTKIGRIGNGPGEYQIPLRLFALPADSSAILDMGNSGFAMVILPSGKPGGGIANPSQSGQGGMFDTRTSTDGAGRLYRTIYRSNVDLGEGTALVRRDRASGRSDTLLMFDSRVVSPLLQLPKSGRSGQTMGGRTAMVSGPLPFASYAQWAVAPDGRVALVTVSPYRVTFVDAAGKKTEGPIIPTTAIPVSDELKQAWREEHQRPVLSMTMNRGGATSYGMSPAHYVEPDKWPDELPPFLTDRTATFAPDGLLWVQRTTAANAPRRFDLIDSSGRVVSQLALPAHTQFVGFGAHSVYLARVDDSDLQYLQRYALPR